MTSRFKNIDNSRPTKLIKIVKRVLHRKKAKQGEPAPQVAPKINELKKPVQSKHDLRLTWLGHSGWLLQLKNLNFLIDPIIIKKLGGVVKAKAKFLAKVESLPKIDLVLISHDHYDHLNKKIVKKINARVIAGVGMGTIIRSKKIQIVELKWWESFMLDGIKITFVPSQHCSRRGLMDQNKRLWGGFIIEARGTTIYHAGDSAYFSGFKTIGDKFPGIDFAFLPIGGYCPEKLRHNNHLTPEQAIQSYLDLRAKYFLPMHWGSFRMSDEPLDEPPKRLKNEWSRKKLKKEHLVFMAVGETKNFDNRKIS